MPPPSPFQVRRAERSSAMARRIDRLLRGCACLVLCYGCGPASRSPSAVADENVRRPVAVAAPGPPVAPATAPTARAGPAPLDPRASCLAPLPEHTEPSPCPAAAPPAACHFAQATELFRRRDYPAAAEQFIELSLQVSGELGRASGENALVSIASMLGDRPRGCRALYESLAPTIIARHCPLPQSASEQECHTIHRLHFGVQKQVVQHDFERSGGTDPARAAAVMRQLFERYCMAGGPLNGADHDPVAAGCDEALSNAYRLFLQLGNTQEADRLRAIFVDPANRLGASPYAQDFANPSTPQPSPP